MLISKDEIKEVAGLFKVIEKSRFNDLDANDIISLYQYMVAGKKLEDKMVKDMEKPVEVVGPVKEEPIVKPNKSSKKVTKVKPKKD